MSQAKKAKPVRCIDAVIKRCDECPYGQVIYPTDVESKHDVPGSSFETACVCGFDQGDPKDEPTAEELAEVDELMRRDRI